MGDFSSIRAEHTFCTGAKPNTWANKAMGRGSLMSAALRKNFVNNYNIITSYTQILRALTTGQMIITMATLRDRRYYDKRTRDFRFVAQTALKIL